MKDVKNFVISAVLAACFPAMVVAENLTISVPAVSDNGAYVVKLIADENLQNSSFKTEVELYRNRDGGEYALIASGPLFKAISQLVNNNGTYGYKVRWKSQGSDAREIRGFSDEAFITVSARVTRNDFVQDDNFAQQDKRSKPAQEMKVVSVKP